MTLTKLSGNVIIESDTAPSNQNAVWIDTSEEDNPVKVYVESLSDWASVQKSLQKVQEESLLHSDGFAPGFAG